LNLQNIANGVISGLNEEMMNFVTNESMERFVYEIDDQFFEQLTSIDNDLPTLTSEKKDLIDIEKYSKPLSTVNQTNRENCICP